MKRSNQPNTGPPNKAKKPDGIVLRLLIPSRAAGIIIGKKGETIKKIRQDHNARMNIPDANGPERVFIIEAEMQTCFDVIKDLIPKLKDILDGNLSDPKVIMGKRQTVKKEEGSDEEDIIDIRILVHQSQAGCVIGRGGEKIRELRQSHNMKVIKVYQMTAPGSTDRVVQMVANAENVMKCLECVVDSLENAPPRGPRQDYQADYFNEHIALEYGGWMSQGGPKGPPPAPMMPYDYAPYPPSGPPGMYPPRGAPPMRGGGGAGGPPQKGGRRGPGGPPPPHEKSMGGGYPPAAGSAGGYDSYYPPAGGAWDEPVVDNWM